VRDSLTAMGYAVADGQAAGTCTAVMLSLAATKAQWIPARRRGGRVLAASKIAVRSSAARSSRIATARMHTGRLARAASIGRTPIALR